MTETVTEQSLLEQVSRENLMTYTKNIATEVRLSGSDEEWRAFLYAKELLDSFGLSTYLYKRKGFISLPGSAELKVDGVAYSSITHSMAVSTSEEGLTGKLVYVGTGAFEEFTGKDVAGNIVLIDGLAIPGAVKTAQENGAHGVVFINAEYTHEMIVSTVWGNPTFEKKDQYPKIPAVSVNFADGEKIKQQLHGNESIPVWFKTKVDTGWRDIPTLEAEIKAEEETDQFILFSGHIDSWHLGTMDNGTANATMLEVARILANVKGKLKRNIRFAFWSGHSHGRYAGSALYCDEHWEELYDSCILHVNIDSVGGQDSVVLTEGNTMSETKSIAQEVIQEQVGQLFEGTRFGRAGDQSFWGPGIPSLLMGLSEQVPTTTPASQAFARLFGGGKAGGFGWWWHTTEDTLDKIDPALLERDCKIYLAIIYKTSTSPILPIDQREAVKELTQHLIHYKEMAPNVNGLEKALVRLETLQVKVNNLYSQIECSQFSDEEVKAVNKLIHALSKGLVRLNYVGKDEFDHDIAAGQPPIPLLADIVKWKDIQEGTPEYFMYETTIKRNVNKVNFILRELISKVENL